MAKVRHEWFQTDTHISVSVFAKNLNRDAVNVTFQERQVRVSAQLPSGEDFLLELCLANLINPEECSYRLTPSKIELKMKKVVGDKWETLEAAQGNKEPSANAGYPSSYKKKTDFDAIARKAEQEEKNEKPEGDAALNKLFAQIYEDGNEDLRRAMNKSFVESGGTVLSTNWGEVGKSKVDMKPPDGVEFKKWDS